jgi:hypothetical protein
MKMVKSLLLGSAAGILAVAGAQAADLPVKAKPVEYVKVCALYGAGFYYIPGTDTCLKIGGFVRADYGFNAGGSHGQYWDGPAVYNRNTHDFQTRVRWNLTLDARTQTEYGTLRSYIRAGMQYSTTNLNAPDGQIYYDRAFIQLGGFTFGKTLSFYDAFSGGFNSYTTLVGASDTGNGINVAAYTAQFGNGFTGTISIEDKAERQAGIYWAGAAGVAGDAWVPGTAAFSHNREGGQSMPDIVANLRADQAWGTAQLSAAVHQVRATYYGTANLETGGHPDEKYGWAVQGALQFKLPWAAGDTFTLQAGYSEGATAYVYGNSNGKSNIGLYSGSTVFPGMLVDGVYAGTGVAGNTSIELTKIFGINGGIEHYWTPTLRSSLFGSYVSVDGSDLACVGTAAGNPWASVVGCNPDWNMYQVGTRTVWNPVRNLDVGLEVLYTKFESDMSGVASGAAFTPGSGKPTQVYTVEDRDVVSALIRVQRNFWP